MKSLIAVLIASLTLAGCIVVPVDGGYYGERHYHHRDWR